MKILNRNFNFTKYKTKMEKILENNEKLDSILQNFEKLKKKLANLMHI